MNSSAYKNIVVTVLMIGATLIGCGGGPAPGPAIPEPDVSEMESMVVKVLEEARNVVVTKRESSEAWGRLGAAYHAHKLRNEAEVCYRRALDLAPREFRWAYFLALVRADSGAGPEEVEELFAYAARLSSDYAPLHLRAGQALLAHGRFDASKEAFERAIEIDATIGAAHRGLGQASLKLGEATKAVEALTRAAELTTTDGAVYSALARAYQAADMPEKARSAAERSKREQHRMTIDDPLLLQHVDSMGASARHWFSRAQEDLARGDMDEALRDLAIVERRHWHTWSEDASFLPENRRCSTPSVPTWRSRPISTARSRSTNNLPFSCPTTRAFISTSERSAFAPKT